MQHVKAAWATAIRVAVLGILHISARLIARVEVHGLEHDAGAPRTYLAISHKRDLDAMAPLTPILLHRGWRALAHDLHFAMRSDGFTPGFLARMVGRPRWLAHLLRPLSVGKVLRALGIHPIQDLRLRPGEEWIRDVLREEGDPPAGDVLTTDFLAQVAASAHESRARLERSRLSELLHWRYQAALQPYMGAEILVPGARRRADQRALASAKGYLNELAEWLWQGGSVYSSPEGRLSPDGRLSPITSGFHRVLRAAPPETQVVPIFVMYDFITTARPRVFVDLAPAIPHAPELPRATLDERLRQAWLGNARFTCTQLASGFLVRASRQPAAPFTLAELTDHLHAEAAALAAEGRHVDRRLLHPPAARRLASRYMAFVARRGFVRRAGRDAWMPLPLDLTLQVAPNDVGYPAAPVAYAWNELSEMLSAAALTEAPGEPPARYASE